MNYHAQGLKVLGLSVIAVLGLMACTVSGAQAGGKLLVEGSSPPFSEWFNAKVENTLAGRLRVLGLNLELFCHEANSALNTLSSAGSGSFVITFESCLAQGVNGEGKLVGAACKGSHSITATGLALVILHSGGSSLSTSQHGWGTGNPYILFSMHGHLFFSKVVNENEECLMPESAYIKGCAVAGITTGDQVQHLITTKGLSSLFGCTLTYGANTAHLEGDALVSLWDGARKWGVE